MVEFDPSSHFRHEAEHLSQGSFHDAPCARRLALPAMLRAEVRLRSGRGRPLKSRGAKSQTERRHVHDQVTERVIKALEAGTVPWQKPWGAMGGWPRSMASGDRYRGINLVLLGMTAEERGYSSPWWGTFKQIQALGGHVMKGQNEREGKGSTTILWAERRERYGDDIDPETGEVEVSRYLVAHAWHVFNAAQCEGLPERFYPQPGTAEVRAEPQAVLDGYLKGPEAPQFDEVPSDRAYYRTDGSDRIVIPLRTQFKSPGHYYSTAFHEVAHSTGAPARLNRPGIADFDHFGSGQYAQEELVAQMGSAMLVVERITEPTRQAEASAARALSADVTMPDRRRQREPEAD